MTIMYCPACGESSDLETELVLQPGEVEIICRKCGTTFDVSIAFYEITEDEREESEARGAWPTDCQRSNGGEGRGVGKVVEGGKD